MISLQLQRKAWPVDAYAEESDFAAIFEQLEAVYKNQKVKDIGDDEWAENFVTKGQELTHLADDLVFNSSVQDAITYYM